MQLNSFQIEQIDSESLENQLDECIITALEGPYRAFCISMEDYLIQFVKSPKVKEMIPGLDKFQRKIIHKLCERFYVLREFVEVKSGDITISKTEQTCLPVYSIQDLLRKRELDRNKQVIEPQKAKKILFKKNSTPQTLTKPQSKTKTENTAEIQAQKQEEAEIQKKNEQYEEARRRIMGNPKKNSLNQKPQLEPKKTGFDSNDPDYNRNLVRPIIPQPIFNPIYYPMMGNPMINPQIIQNQINNPMGMQQNLINNPMGMQFQTPMNNVFQYNMNQNNNFNIMGNFQNNFGQNQNIPYSNNYNSANDFAKIDEKKKFVDINEDSFPSLGQDK